jgi:hypothetical protein
VNNTHTLLGDRSAGCPANVAADVLGNAFV